MNEKRSDKVETSGGDGATRSGSTKLVPKSDTVDTK